MNVVVFCPSSSARQTIDYGGGGVIFALIGSTTGDYGGGCYFRPHLQHDWRVRWW